MNKIHPELNHAESQSLPNPNPPYATQQFLQQQHFQPQLLGYHPIFPISAINNSLPAQNCTVLQDEEIIRLDRKQSHEIRLKQRRERQAQHESRLAAIEFSELEMLQLENSRIVARLSAEESKRNREFAAAIVLQKYTRRWLALRRIPDLKVNELAKYINPASYILEALILEVTRDEFVADILVELGDDHYYPYTKTSAFRCIRLRYHIFEETLQEIVVESVRDFLDDFARHLKESPPSLEPIEESCEMLLEDVVGVMAREVLLTAVDEIVQTYLVESKSEALFVEILDEIFMELELAQDCMSEMLRESVMDDFILEVTRDTIREIAKELSKIPGATILDRAATRLQSRFVDFIMDKTLDNVISSLLLQIVATNGASFFVSDMVELLMDQHIAELLISEFAAAESYKANTTLDFGIPLTPSNMIPPSAEYWPSEKSL